MQDLGKITIDITEGGGGAEGISGLASEPDADGAIEAVAQKSAGLATTMATMGTAFAAAFASIVSVAKKVVDALEYMDRVMMDVADDLRSTSPGIQLAEMQNELAMFSTKMRAGFAFGDIIGGTMLERGRIQRILADMKYTTGAIFAVILKPLLRTIGDILELLKSAMPMLIEAFGKLLQGIGGFYGAGSRAMADNPVLESIIQATNPLLWMAFKKGAVIDEWFKMMAKDLRKIADNTEPKIDFNKVNAPFFADLRLMGVKV